MDFMRKMRAYFLIAGLVFSLGVVSCRTSQESTGAGNQHPVETSAPAMSTAEIIRQMNDLKDEITRAREKMENSPGGLQGTITLSKGQLASMCENMQYIIDNMTRLVTDLDRMASKDEPLTNEAYREYAARMLASMKNCVGHAEALWEGTN